MILVPVKIVGLIVDENGNGREYADIAVSYSLLDSYSVLGGEIEPKPFTKTAPLPAGVHLHFILPDGLTQGRETEKGIEYPAVPDRFLITRFQIDQSIPDQPEIHHKAWILESNYVGMDNTDSVTIPEFSDSTCRYRYLGRVYPYEETRSPGSYLEKLTAVGAGTPWFAACYQTCRSVFGFYDDMEEASKGEYTYTAVGWYSREEQSPLYGLSGEEYSVCLNELGFSLEEEYVRDCDAELILHGSLLHVKWDGRTGHYEAAGPSGRVSAAWGNSSTEAFSALAAKKLSERTGRDRQDLERILNMIQTDQLGTLYGPDGILKSEDRMHRARFGSMGDRNEWRLLPTGEEISADAELDKKLEKLNALEQECTAQKDQIESKKQELYDAWYTYMLLYAYPSPPIIKKPLTPEQIMAEAEKIVAELEVYQSSFEEMQKQKESLSSELEQKARQAGMSLEISSAQEQYYVPLDPVFLIAGEGADRTDLFGEDGRYREDDKLLVRKDSRVISEVSYQKAGKAISWDQETISRYCDAFPSREDVPECFRNLNDETLFYVLSEGADEVHREGLCPSPVAITKFRPPWNPLFLDWRVHVLPSRTTAEPDDTMDYWELGDMDYSYCGTLLSHELKQYRGRMLLLPQAAQELSDAILRDLEYFKEDPALYERLKEMAQQAKTLPVLSQPLGSIKEAFLCKEQAYSFPIFGVTEEAEEFSRTVREWAGEYGELALNVNQDFLPLRGAAMTLDTIRLTDTFGQIVQADGLIDETVIAESMYQEGAAEKGYAMLQPRMNGPARLVFEWGDEADSSDAVCGYLMPDFLNHRLGIHDASGGYMGNLHLVHLPGGGTGARYSSLETKKRGDENTHLLHFIRAMTDSRDGVFKAFLEILDKRLSEQTAGDGEQEQELAFLTGHPLAMVRARTGIQWQGRLPYAKNLEQFGKRNTFGFEKNRISARLGDIRYAGDSVAGYYVGGADAATYQTFYPPYGIETEERGYFKCNHELKLKMQQRDESGREELSLIGLTLLLDVKNSVHIRTGILPVLEKKPGSDMFGTALEEMHLQLPFYPVIGERNELNLPQLDTVSPFFWTCREEGGSFEEAVQRKPQETAQVGKNYLMDGVMRRKEERTDAGGSDI